MAGRRSRSRFKKHLFRPEELVLGALSRVVRPFSLASQLRVGVALGGILWLVSFRRRLSIENASLALGVGHKEARRIARAAHVHLGRLLIEFLTTTSYLRPERAALLELENFDYLREAHAEGVGVVMVTAHLGNWELLGLRQALEGLPLLVLGRVPKNPYLAKRMLAQRELCGNGWIPRRRALLTAAKALQAGKCVGTAVDQHTASPPRMTAPFLGRPARLATAVFELAVRLDCPVVPCVTIPKPQGGYRIVYYPSLRASDGGSREEKVRDLAGRCHRLAEGWIRRRPETWFWFHDLWKSERDRV